ncbi:MAG: phosphotransferase enzyme family protein [Paracoccaceae bacterium]
MTVHLQAVEAATHWQGRILRLIRNRENAVFEMDGPFGRAALRLHRIGYQTAATIRSELWWCDALASAGVPVPRPLRTGDGALMVQLSDGRLASAVAWVDGEPLGETGQPLTAPLPALLEQHHALGRLLAQMHQATDLLTLPADFDRPRWDAEGLVGEAPLWGRFWEHPAATQDQRADLERVRDGLREWLGASNTDCGLIHADVLRENVLVNTRSLTLIDFDDSGFGYRPYDLGTAMLGNHSEPAYADLLAALVAGYSEIRPTDAETVETFTLARACASIGWTMPRLHRADPINQSHIARALKLAKRLIP